MSLAPGCPGASRSSGSWRTSPRATRSRRRVAAPLVAAARARPPAVPGRADARRRHRAVRPPGRRALRHADRAAGRGAAQRQRERRAARSATSRRARLRGAPGRGGPARGAREDEPDEDPVDWSDPDEDVAEAAEDPNAAKRFWFEHATGAGKTVAALGFVEASRTGGILILTHRRNLVDQFHGELRDRGYAKRISPALLADKDTGTARSRSRPTSGSSATRARSPTPTRSSSATRRTPRSARRPRPRSAPGPARCSSA